MLAVALHAGAVLERQIDAAHEPGAPDGRRHAPTVDLRQAIAGATLHQRLEHPAVGQAQVEFLGQLVEGGDAAQAGADLEDGLNGALAKALDGGQTEAHAFGHDGEVPLALVDVGRQHGDTPVAALGDVERQLVGVGRFDGQQRRGEVPRVVGLEVGRLVGEERVGRRVRLVEAVAGEVLHQLEDLGRPSSR